MYLHQITFKIFKSDNFLFIWRDSKGQLFIIVYVDDLVIGGEHIVNFNNIKKLLFGYLK